MQQKDFAVMPVLRSQRQSHNGCSGALALWRSSRFRQSRDHHSECQRMKPSLLALLVAAKKPGLPAKLRCAAAAMKAAVPADHQHSCYDLLLDCCHCLLRLAVKAAPAVQIKRNEHM
jgi:hypothetical protein